MDASRVREKSRRSVPPQGSGAAYRKYGGRKVLLIALLGVALIAVAVVSLGLGSARLSPLKVVEIIFGGGDARSAQIVLGIRLPRVLAAIAAGLGLALAGCVMQNVLQNPLASDYTLGVSQGAAFGAAVAILVGGAGSANAAGAVRDAFLIANPFLVTISAFAGAMAVTLAVLLLARLRGVTPEVMVLAGVAMGSLFSAGTVIVQFFATDVQVASIVFWTFGDIGRASWRDLAIIAGVTVPVTVWFLLKRWDYNALGGGDDIAHSLGVNVGRTRTIGMLLTSLVTATAVSFLGIIAFVGLLAPHLMRRVVGGDYRYLIPGSALAGALLLLVSDTFSRMIIAPVVLPVGAVTSVLGAPLFVYLLIRGFIKSGRRAA
ncbi:MAG: iron ABC transporter permease [Spirochaetales bacterium]|nr:iron ABC transporter permease [Spirochaetales bacterium]